MAVTMSEDDGLNKAFNEVLESTDQEDKVLSLFAWQELVQGLTRFPFNFALVREFAKAVPADDTGEVEWRSMKTTLEKFFAVRNTALHWELFRNDPEVLAIVNSDDFPSVLKAMQAVAAHPNAYVEWMEREMAA